MPAELVFTPPAGWTPTEVAPPTLTDGSGVERDEWHAWKAPDGQAGRAVSACFGMDLGMWLEEARPFAQERLAATAGSVAMGLAEDSGGLHVERETRSAATSEQTLVSTSGASAQTYARSVLGFTRRADVSRVEGCFVVCAPASAACMDAALAAPTVGFVEAPPPGALGHGLAFGIHHPRGVASSAAALFLLAGVVAVWTRPRPLRK